MSRDIPLSALLLRISDELQTVSSGISRTHGITSHLHWEAMTNHPEAVDTIQELDHLEQVVKNLQTTLASLSNSIQPEITIDSANILSAITLSRLADRLRGDDKLITGNSGDVDLF